MKIGDDHFMKYAGGQPPRQMRRQQRLAALAQTGEVSYEKPPGHPDRPDTMDRKRMEAIAAGLPETDNPSKIAASLGAFRPPVPEGQEEGAVKDGPDIPGTILKSMGQFAPPSPQAPPLPELDDPGAVTRPLSQPGPAPEAAPPALEADTPAATLAGLVQARLEEKVQPPLPGDSPSDILSTMGRQRQVEAAPSAIEADTPSAILASMGRPGPLQAVMPGPAPTAIDVPTDARAPEADTGRIVRGTA